MFTDISVGSIGEKGTALSQAAWAWWNEDGLCRGDRYAALLPDMQISAPCPTSGFRFVHVGADTTTADVYGRDWAINALGVPTIPDERLEAVAIEAYFEAMTRPHFDLVQTVIQGPDYPLYICYQRLILPIEICPGAPGVAAFTSFVEKPSPVS